MFNRKERRGSARKERSVSLYALRVFYLAIFAVKKNRYNKKIFL